jgi:hypothetical protein
VAGVYFRILLADLLEDPLPEVVGKDHGVRFVAHADALEIVAPGVIECVANDALDTLARVNVFLDGDFVARVFLEETADADVEAFRVFAEDDKPDVGCGALPERREAFVKELNRAGVHKEVQLETQAEQNVRGVLVGWNARITKCAEENRVELV